MTINDGEVIGKMDNWVIPAVLLGVVVLALAIVIGMSGGHAPQPSELLPAEISGFELANRFDHIEPIFSGERYSTLVSFAPAADSAFAGKVERMGITAYVFKNKKSAAAALEMLISSTYSNAQEVPLDSHKAQFFLNSTAGQAGLIWQDGMVVYEIFVTAPTDGTPDTTALKEAALAGAHAVIGRAK